MSAKEPSIGHARPVTKLVPEAGLKKLKAHINAQKRKLSRESAKDTLKALKGNRPISDGQKLIKFKNPISEERRNQRK